MKQTVATLLFIMSISILIAGIGSTRAAEVDFPAIRRYPPGYYGAGYYSPRLYPRASGVTDPKDPFKWDKFMSRELGVEFPFFPIPYPWDYGTGLTFNFPDFNANDWR